MKIRDVVSTRPGEIDNFAAMKIWARTTFSHEVGIRVGRQREKSGVQEANFFETRGMYLEGRRARSLPFAPFPFSSSFRSYQQEREEVINTCVYSSTTFPPSSPPSPHTSAFVLEYSTTEFLVTS